MSDSISQPGRRNIFSRIGGEAESKKSSRRQHLKASIQVIVKPDLYQPLNLQQRRPGATQTTVLAANPCGILPNGDEILPDEGGDRARDILRRNSALTASLTARRGRDAPGGDGKVVGGGRRRYRTADALHFRQFDPTAMKTSSLTGNLSNANTSDGLKPGHSETTCRDALQRAAMARKSLSLRPDGGSTMDAACRDTSLQNLELSKKVDVNLLPKKSTRVSCSEVSKPERAELVALVKAEVADPPLNSSPDSTTRKYSTKENFPGRDAKIAHREPRDPPERVPPEGNNAPSERYDDEEYVEDLAQLDVLLHYVNNLSASLEFLDWEKNKRISTDLVPTLLDIYDALYAKFTDPPGGPASSSLTAPGVSKRADVDDNDTGVQKETHNINNLAAVENETKSQDTSKNICNNSSPLSDDQSHVTSNPSSSRSSNENALLREGASVIGSEENFEEGDISYRARGEPDHNYRARGGPDNNYRARGEPDNSLMGSSVSAHHSSTALSRHDTSPRLPSVPSPAISIITETQDCVNETLSRGLPLPRQVVHPSVAHIPPRSPIHPRRVSPPSTHDVAGIAVADPKLTLSHCASTSTVRPLSSVSSSSSSSSNSLRRGHTGVNTSYLASVESLVEADEEVEASPASGRRRERSLKVRRDFRGHHLSRPGSCDSGVAACHGLAALSPAPSTAPTTTSVSNHHRHHDHQYPHHLLQRHHLHHPAYDEGKPISHMDLLVMEVLDTEASYVHGLMEVIQGYLEPWLRGEDRGVSPLQATELFSNLTEIHDFNRLLLKELEGCGVDPVRLARIFVRNNTGFSIYTQYCTHYPRTVSLLTELMSNAESVLCFRERQQALGHTLPLGSYLLKPVQRILKYHLLLENILKNFDRDGNTDGYNVILNARNAMTGMAHHINDMKRKHEHCVRVQEIQSLLYGWQGADLTTFGELAAEGTFRIVSAKGIRHVFLFSKMLLICKKKVENILMYKTHIMCSNLMLIESIPREPLCFQVIPFDNPRLQYTLQARNRDHKHEWTQQLKRLILENYSAEIPPHARQLVMELGRTKQDEVLPLSGSSSGRRQVASSGPEYLQKRKRRCRRSSEVPSTPASTGARLRLRRLSKDSVESGRSRSASRGRDTEDDDDTQRSLLPLSDKPKLRLSMWRRRSEPNVPKSSHSLDAPASPSTPSVYSTAPTTPTHVLADDAEETQISELTQRGRELLDTPEVLVVSTLPDHLSPTRLSFSGRCSVVLQSAHSSELSPRSAVYVQVDSLSISECEREDSLSQSKHGDDDEDGESTQENLEEIVSQLLQHNLHLQKLLLSKHRRGLLTRKRSRGLTGRVSNTASETSDTENDDVTSHDSGLPITSINSMNSINHVLPFPEATNCLAANRMKPTPLHEARLASTGERKPLHNYVEFYLEGDEKTCVGGYFSNSADTATRETGSSSEGLSAYSSAVSISQRDAADKTSIGPADASNLGSSNFDTRRATGSKRSIPTYDNLSNVWSSRINRNPERRFMDNSSVDSNCSVKFATKTDDQNITEDTTKILIRRAQSFSSQTSLETRDHDSRIGDASSDGHSTYSSSCKDRPVTIAVYDNGVDVTADQVSDKCSVDTCSTIKSSPLNESVLCDEQFTDCSENVQLESSFNVHPEHKIYTNAMLSRHSLKNVINKLVSARKSSTQEEAAAVSSCDAAGGEKTPGKLVYSMARQCTKTLKERIKQIRSEEECSITNSESSPHTSTRTKPLTGVPSTATDCVKSNLALQEINAMSQYKQGSSSIGEKLATNNIISLKRDSASDKSFVETGQSKSSEVGTTATTSTNASPSDTLNGLDDLNLDDSSGSLEEFEDDNSGGDSYYERSFEVIEDMLENDLFRDSAIYSDPEDPDSKISVSDLTRNFPRSILNRVSKSPSVRSDRSNYSGKNSLPRKSPSFKSSFNGNESTQDICEKTQSSEKESMDSESVVSDTSIVVPQNNESCKDVETNGFASAKLVCNETDKVDESSLHAECSTSSSVVTLLVADDDTSMNSIEASSSIVTNVSKDKNSHLILNVSSSDIPEEACSTEKARGDIECDSTIQPIERTAKTLTRAKLSKSDASLAVSAPCTTKRSPMACTSSPRKKTPPPVPVKPGVCSKASRPCGSKILTQLKSLEECTKFSKTSSGTVVELDGLKSLEERRKELKSSTEGNKNAKESKPDAKTEGQSVEHNCEDSTMQGPCIQGSSETEKRKVPSSPLMTVRSFVTRNVANVTTSLRSSRATTRQTVTLVSATEASLGLPPASNISKAPQDACDGASYSSAEEFDKGIVHTRNPVQNISITRRKSIGNYISKFNSRSSSVPPKLRQRFDNCQSALPSDTSHNDETAGETALPSNIKNKPSDENSTKKIHSSASFPESFTPSDLCSLPYESARTDDIGPLSLPAPPLPSSDSDDSSSSSSGGVVIEKRRPKGWVRHVVGRLQQSEVAQRTPKVAIITDVECGS